MSTTTPPPILPDGLSDEEIPGLSREVRNIIQPVKLSPAERFTFRCHPGVSCFNACCSHMEIILTPYDMLRLRERLSLTPEEFLLHFADATFLPKGDLPVAIIRMDPDTGRCPFNTDQGCSVYTDRPVACRYYPIGMALMRAEESTSRDEFQFLIRESYCQGHHEATEWTVAEWKTDQGINDYDDHNKLWMEIILKRRSAGDLFKTSTSLKEIFYTASTNPPTFRRFVFDSTFLQRYEIDEAIQESIRGDDLALTHFAMEWLGGVLYGQGDFQPTAEAVKLAAARQATAKERRLKEVQERAEQGLDDGYEILPEDISPNPPAES